MAAEFVVVQQSSKIPLSLCSIRLSASLFVQVAEKNKDVQLIDFVEIEFLAEQVETIRKISEYFAQLRTLHKGHDFWAFLKLLPFYFDEILMEMSFLPRLTRH